MHQYNLIYPNNKKIYYDSSPKNVALKVFKNISKCSNTQQIRICLENNNTKKKYHYIAMTNKKLNKYKNLIDQQNPNQIG